MDKRIDILLSQSDFWKIVCVGSFGVFLSEWLSTLDKTEYPDSTGYKIAGGFIFGSIAGLVMYLNWRKANKLAENKIEKQRQRI